MLFINVYIIAYLYIFIFAYLLRIFNKILFHNDT